MTRTHLNNEGDSQMKLHLSSTFPESFSEGSENLMEPDICSAEDAAIFASDRELMKRSEELKREIAEYIMGDHPFSLDPLLDPEYDSKVLWVKMLGSMVTQSEALSLASGPAKDFISRNL